MANKIAINDEDFTSLEENLIAKHKSIIELVGNVVKQLQDLSRRDGEFYTDSTSLYQTSFIVKTIIKERNFFIYFINLCT